MTLTILALLVVALGVGVVFWVRLGVSLRRFKIKKAYTAAIEAPSVSVCIPARNEMHALSDCLERVLASTFPKLEIIVFDDDSVDETSAIVRSFAYAGVRFVKGEALPAGWLGRNFALDALAREASGTFVVFLDVDTALRPTTISELVGYAITEDVDMLSVIPRRLDRRFSVFFSPLRYFWQLVRLDDRRAAVSGALWLARRKALLQMDGLRGAESDVEPEAILATQFAGRYHCLLGGLLMDVHYQKKWSSQCDTSRRLLYPLFGGTMRGATVGLLLLLLLNLPTACLLAGFWGWDTIQWLALLVTLLFAACYTAYTRAMWRYDWWLGALLWPIIAAQEAVLFVGSVWAHGRGIVRWRGRHIAKNG